MCDGIQAGAHQPALCEAVLFFATVIGAQTLKYVQSFRLYPRRHITFHRPFPDSCYLLCPCLAYMIRIYWLGKVHLVCGHFCVQSTARCSSLEPHTDPTIIHSFFPDTRTVAPFHTRIRPLLMANRKCALELLRRFTRTPGNRARRIFHGMPCCTRCDGSSTPARCSGGHSFFMAKLAFFSEKDFFFRDLSSLEQRSRYSWS